MRNQNWKINDRTTPEAFTGGIKYQNTFSLLQHKWKKKQIKWCLGPCSPLPQILNLMSQGPCILKKIGRGLHGQHCSAFNFSYTYVGVEKNLAFLLFAYFGPSMRTTWF